MELEQIAQVIGIFAMAMNCLSFQFKQKKQILAFQLCGSALFAVNFFMLGAFAGGLLNAIGIFRAIVYMKEQAFRAKHVAWVYGFGTLFVLSYVAVFTLFEKPFVGWTPVASSRISMWASSSMARAMVSSCFWPLEMEVPLSERTVS